jgi:hypothetical protein
MIAVQTRIITMPHAFSLGDNGYMQIPEGEFEFKYSA